MEIYVLIQSNKKSGKIVNVITAMGMAMLKMWALKNTSKTKQTFIFERNSGKMVFACSGSNDGFPTIAKDDKLTSCEDVGIALDDLRAITDDRFDN